MKCAHCRNDCGLGVVSGRRKTFCSKKCLKRYERLNPPRPIPWRIIGIVIVALLALALCTAAHANPWEGASPELKKWFQDQVDNDGNSCCNDSDGFHTEVVQKNGHYQFYEYGEWWEIPPETIKFVDLPEELKKFRREGLSIVFRNYVTGTMYIHCVRMQRPLY